MVHITRDKNRWKYRRLNHVNKTLSKSGRLWVWQTDYFSGNLLVTFVLTRISRNWTISAENPKFRGVTHFCGKTTNSADGGKVQSLLLTCFERSSQMQVFQFSWQLILCKQFSNGKCLINDFASHSYNDRVTVADVDNKEGMLEASINKFEMYSC